MHVKIFLEQLNVKTCVGYFFNYITLGIGDIDVSPSFTPVTCTVLPHFI